MAGPRNFRRRWVAAKIETTKGTAISLTGSDAKLLVFDPKLEQEMERESRAPAGLASGELAALPGAYNGRFTCRVEARGSGTAGTLPLWASTLLVACGHAVTTVEDTSNTLAPISSFDSQSTVTIALWEDGVKKSLAGAMGTFKVGGEYGKRVFIDFDFRGIWQAPVDEAAPSITHETTGPLRLAGATFSVGSSGSNISRIEFDQRARVELRPGIGNASALSHAYLGPREAPMVRFDPEARLVADHDIFGLWLAGTTQALSLAIGSAAGNTITLAVPRLQYINPKDGERNGMQIYDVESKAIALAGDDEYSIAFT